MSIRLDSTNATQINLGLQIMALLSDYMVPTEKTFHIGLVHWLLFLRQKQGASSVVVKKTIERALNNLLLTGNDLELDH